MGSASSSPLRSPRRKRDRSSSLDRDRDVYRRRRDWRDTGRSDAGRGREFGDRGPTGRYGLPPPAAEAPEAGTIHLATVASVQPYGVFVEMPGFRKQGMVHHSQVGRGLHVSSCNGGLGTGGKHRLLCSCA
jgi:hypothetical protein